MKKFLLMILSISLLLLSSCSPKASNTVDNSANYLYEKDLKLQLDVGERDGVYTGSVKNGLPDGFGTFKSQRPDDGINWVYYGEWKDGHFSGDGFSKWDDGQKYVGDYKDDYMNGTGILTTPDGGIYVGEFKDGNYVGLTSTIYDFLSENYLINKFEIHQTGDIVYNIPSTWKEVDDGTRTYYYPTTGALTLQIFDANSSDLDSDQIKELLDGLASGIAGSSADYSEISSEYTNINSNVIAKKLLYNCTYNNSKYENSVIAFYYNGNVYSYAYSQPSEITDTTVFDYIIGSIVMIK